VTTNTLRPVCGPAIALATAVALAAGGCGSGVRDAREVIEPFMAAVQAGDAEALFCLMTGAADSEELGGDEAGRSQAFAAWVQAQTELYEYGRDEGRVELNQHGIVAVKLFALGRGTYYDLSRVQAPESDLLRVRMDVRFGYAAVDLSGFSPGTTFYVCGVPPGRVHAIRKPRRGGEETAEVLDRLSLEWTLVHGDGGGSCPAGWTVASVTALEETATTKRITWVF
jgi:hypothetical protein